MILRPGRDTPWDTRVMDESGKNVFIRSSECASYITEEFYSALNVFYMCENLGCLPFAGGWAEQPAWITQAISVLKVERYKVDEEEREEKQRHQEEARKHVR